MPISPRQDDIDPAPDAIASKGLPASPENNSAFADAVTLWD